MASTDAIPCPKKAVAYRVTFPLYDATGSLVTGATSLDSEISKDGGTFTDCTNEATEIATSSGMYYLELSSTEMNADTVAVIVKSGNAKTLPIVIYPQEGGDIRVDVQTWLQGSMPAADTTGYPIVTIKRGTGAGELDITSGNVALTSTANTAVCTALMATTTENNGSLTFKTILRVLAAVVAGRVSISGSTVTFKTADNAKTRATVTTDSSNNRTAVTLDGTD